MNSCREAELKGGVSVVTGGASGIGFAICERAARTIQGPVIVADVEEGALQAAVDQLRAAFPRIDVHGVRTDVTDPTSVAALASFVKRMYPNPHIALLCANAGVAAGKGVLHSTQQDWAFTYAVNVFGVASTLRELVPIMQASGKAGAVVNTSSMAGVMRGGSSPYASSKHAVAAMTEGLYTDLNSPAISEDGKEIPSTNKISVHLLCPAIVNTKITSSLRNRGKQFQREPGSDPESEDFVGGEHISNVFKNSGMPASDIADYLFRAIQDGRFYVYGDNPGSSGLINSLVEDRMTDMLKEQAPSTHDTYEKRGIQPTVMMQMGQALLISRQEEARAKL